MTTKTYWTAPDLLAANLPELVWAVDGIVPEGATLLVGSPKVGKSWMALGLALAVASGGRALGTVHVDPGDVLYLALEDGPRRLRDRLLSLLAGDNPPDRLAFLTDAPSVSDGLADKLTSWASTVPDPRLIVVDVLAKVRPTSRASDNMYAADYAALSPLQDFATAHGIAVLIVHHTRKAKDDDPLATVSGTHGLAGAADAVLVLARSRTSADATLAITGRDVLERNIALSFDSELMTWRAIGEAHEVALSPQRRLIADAVRDAGALTPKAITERTGVDYEVVRKLVVKMADAGQLDTDGAGTYLPLSPIPSVPSIPSQGTLGTQGTGYREGDAA